MAMVLTYLSVSEAAGLYAKDYVEAYDKGVWACCQRYKSFKTT